MTAAPADAQALHVLKSVWGYEQFRGVQQDIVQAVMGGENALVLMPTGGGKSLCYQLPSLLRRGVGVVVSPLIALMKDQVDALRENGVRAAYLNSSLSSEGVREVEAALLSGELDLLYVAPERLLMPRMLELLGRSEVALFAIDEAHCVSQWGHDFRPEYQGLGVLAERFPGLPRLALTATADERTRADIIRVLSLESAHLFVSSFDRPNIQYRIQQKGVGKAGPKSELLDFIRAEHPGEAGIVYCLSRKSVDETAQWLSAQGVAALPYHAGLAPRERSLAQERFLQEEGLIVVATVAFGMGIDKSNVRFVAHLDLPKSMEGYYQETGRAGRDGLPSTAWMTYGLADVVNVRRMLAQSEAPEHIKRVEASKLDALLAYCETASCRRQVLLTYFGETLSEPCGNCDTCLSPPQTFDATRPAQMALSAAIRTGNRFGAAHLTDVLLGNATERVRGLGHHQLPTFGVGTALPERAWRNVMRQLVALGYLTTDAAGHGSLIASAKARPLLRGEETLWLRAEVLTPQSSKKARRGAGGLPLGTPAGGLFEALRALRLKLAREQAVPPYVIFNDATLREMAERRPTSLAVLGTVGGVGTRKLSQYGEAFLEVLSDQTPAPPEAVGAASNNALLDILNRKPLAEEALSAAPPAGRLFATTPVAPGGPDPAAVAGRLRELRGKLSKETGHSAFVVFPNATLEALAEKQPRSVDELRGLPGLGEKRIEAYGEQIVAAVRGEGLVSP